MESYGKELIIDMHDCSIEKFNREVLKEFFDKLCVLIDMEKGPLHFWDDLETPDNEKETEPHLVGTSAIQFIKTSNVTVHTLDILKRAYINIFSCKDFDSLIASNFCIKWFGGIIKNKQEISRI